MQKILIIKHGSLGDIILSMYAIFSIKKHYKNSTFTILTEKRYHEFFKFIPFVDNIQFDDRPKIYSFLCYIKLCRWFYKEKFNWVFDLQTSKRTNLYFYMFSLFANFKWNGIAKKCSHPHLNPDRQTMHTLERQKDQLSFSKVKFFGRPNLSWFYKIPNRFNIIGKYALVVPGGSGK